MGITENKIRVGNITSSNAYKLMSLDRSGKDFGAPAKTYIKEKNIERRLGRSIDIEKDSRATLWGKFLEKRVHQLLPLSYVSCGNVTVQHPEIDYWCGSPDNINQAQDVVGDTKCYEPKNFCLYVDMLLQNDWELFKKEFPEQFWQLVSNSCILGVDNVEAIVYMPYESEIPEIREMAQNNDDPDFYKYRFIAEAPLCELPYLPDNGYFKNLNIIRFKVPQADKDLLTENVKKAGALLIPRTDILLAHHDGDVTVVEGG